jgi:cysteine-rich CPCC protein
MDVGSLLEIGPLDARLRCECCDLPTLRVPHDRYGLHLDEAQVVCPLCEWENRPLTHTVAESEEPASSSERNDGISLAEARSNFAKFLSMYDPEKLEPWMLGPPSAKVLARKRALRDAYADLLAAPERERWDPLNRVKDCEEALAAQVDGERESAQGT